MKYLVRYFYFILITAFLTAGLLGCSSKKDSTPYEMTQDQTSESQSLENGVSYETDFDEKITVADEAAEPETAGDTNTTESSTITDAVIDTRKLIKNVYMDIETKTFQSMISTINTRVNFYGGYFDQTNINGTSYGEETEKNGHMVIRIPQASLNDFIDDLSGLGNIVNRKDSVEDVTLKYVDLETHVKTLRIELNALLKLLEESADLQDIFTIQSQITQVRYEIESYESSLRALQNQVTYSTVTLDLYEVKDEEIAEENPGAFEEIAENFKNNIIEIADGLTNILVVFISNIPYIILWGIFIFILYRIYKIIKVKSKKTAENTEDNK
ncbi:DUF4349 domain-containing protein [Anaeromicropila populeti]|uniref:DUF4349 domain-containing protein n=1 Tax=Anaeromicropila populeti TaxID=37658 RepID=A0A1I6I9C1_9FIRM|nr:DUF4349 domain-containing protein [Anaeromicropila populeti]SFR63355.1 protein of unknown function [Anaeromicropila populeti]